MPLHDLGSLNLAWRSYALWDPIHFITMKQHIWNLGCLYMNSIAKINEVGTAHISCIWKSVFKNKNTHTANHHEMSFLLFCGSALNRNTVLQYSIFSLRSCDSHGTFICMSSLTEDWKVNIKWILTLHWFTLEFLMTQSSELRIKDGEEESTWASEDLKPCVRSVFYQWQN